MSYSDKQLLEEVQRRALRFFWKGRFRQRDWLRSSKNLATTMKP